MAVLGFSRGYARAFFQGGRLRSPLFGRVGTQMAYKLSPCVYVISDMHRRCDWEAKGAKQVLMKAGKLRRVGAAGWHVGTVDELLGLSKQEAALIEVKLRLARRLRALRARRRLSQAAVAELMRSSQSRVAKMERGDSTVSVDLLVRSLLAIGASAKDISRAIAVSGNRARC